MQGKKPTDDVHMSEHFVSLGIWEVMIRHHLSAPVQCRLRTSKSDRFKIRTVVCQAFTDFKAIENIELSKTALIVTQPKSIKLAIRGMDAREKANR